MKRILINALQSEELRIAYLAGQKLQDLEIEPKVNTNKKGNIYKGTVIRIEKGLDAAFIDYGDEKHGFLPFKNISADFLKDPETQQSIPVTEALRKNQTLLVQVQLTERGEKGAMLTNKVVLAGRNIVLMPSSPDCGGVSRRARTNDDQRRKAREVLDQIQCYPNESIILRTSGVGESVDKITSELKALRSIWDDITRTASESSRPTMIYQESGILIRTLRDKLSDDIDEVIIDDEPTYKEARDFAKKLMPENVDKLKLHENDTPLFSEFQIEKQINQVYERKVPMPSGGVLVFDHTEALLSIDINSAKHMRQAGIEATALSVNLEACDEIARQVKLRDVGGLIVIDFIDMESADNRRTVEQRLTQAMSSDHARKRIGSISNFGLLEMSRQRMRASFNESNHVSCPRCDGSGIVRTTESASFAALRAIEEEAAKDRTTLNVYAKLPSQMLEFLINTKREEIHALEKRWDVHVFFLADNMMEVPHFKVVRQRKNEPRPTAELKTHADKASEHNFKNFVKSQRQSSRQPAVETRKHYSKQGNVLGGLFGLFTQMFGKLKRSSDTATDERSGSRSPYRRRSGGQQRRDRDDRGGRDGRQGSQARGRDGRGGRGGRGRGGRGQGRYDRGDGRGDGRSDSRSDNRNDRGRDEDRNRETGRGGQREFQNERRGRNGRNDRNRHDRHNNDRNARNNRNDRNGRPDRPDHNQFTPPEEQSQHSEEQSQHLGNRQPREHDDRHESMTRPDDNIGNRIEDNIGNKIEDKTEQAPTPPKPSFNDTPDIPELGKSTLTQVETKKHP